MAPHAERHVRHTELSAQEGAEDLDLVRDALARAGAPSSPLWRAPYGVEADWTRPLAAERGLRVIGWTLLSPLRGHPILTESRSPFIGNWRSPSPASIDGMWPGR